MLIFLAGTGHCQIIHGAAWAVTFNCLDFCGARQPEVFEYFKNAAAFSTVSLNVVFMVLGVGLPRGSLHVLSLPHALSFPNHVVCILVFSNSEKDRLTKTIIPRPFREFYLADHHRLSPMAAFHFGGG